MRKRSLTALRERYTDGRLPGARVLRELADDPRAGAQSLHRVLSRKVAAVRKDQRKRNRMLALARDLWSRGVDHVAGVDEVGMGPLAGPVVAAAVILPHDVALVGVDDSKQLDVATRERLDREIRSVAVAVSVAEASIDDIERLNIYHAGLESMRRAVCGLDVAPGHVVVDARTIPGLDDTPQTAIVKGDANDYAIACASIVAKVYRDALMVTIDREHPQYGFADHKGYGTERHIDAIRTHGLCTHHRRSYAALERILGQMKT